MIAKQYQLKQMIAQSKRFRRQNGEGRGRTGSYSRAR
jgi:hypothetical protein